MTLLWESPVSVIVAVTATCVAILTRRPLLLALALFIWIFLWIFFRDFDGVYDQREHVLVSPAEGELLNIVETEDAYLLASRLAPWNRHVQIAPAAGVVVFQDYQRGEFNPAYFFEKTDLNERLITAVETRPFGRVLVVQIAGQLARRIRTSVTTGSVVQKGQRLGLIEFGSRVDVVVRRQEGLVLTVKRGDDLRLGQSIASLS